MSSTVVAVPPPAGTTFRRPAFSITSMRPSGVQATPTGPVRPPVRVRSWKPDGYVAAPAEGTATRASTRATRTATREDNTPHYPGYPDLHKYPGGMAVASRAFNEKTDEQKDITEMVRQFVDNEVLPIAEQHDHEDLFPDGVVEQMKELGLFGVTIPEEYGGMGLDLTTYAMIVEELSRGWISVSGIVNTHFIGSYLLMRFGTDEQKQE